MELSTLLDVPSSPPPPPPHRRALAPRPLHLSFRRTPKLIKSPFKFSTTFSVSSPTPLSSSSASLLPIVDTEGEFRGSCSADSSRDATLRSYSQMLRDCASRGGLIDGKAIHARLLRTGVEPDTHLYNCLVLLYSKCGSLRSAHYLFEEMPHRDVVGWTALVAGYALGGNGEEAVKLFCEMKREGVWPNGFAIAAGLKACSMCLDLDFGQQLHGEAMKLLLLSDPFVGSSLVDLYVKCGEMELAEKVFLSLPEHNVVSWNVLLNGYAQVGEERKVLELFGQLMESEMRLNDFTLSIVVKCCTGLGDVRLGQLVHSLVIKIGLEVDEFLSSSLLDMYSKCGLAEDAYKVFVRITEPDVVVWSAMISCFDQLGMMLEAFELFRDMKRRGVKPNKYTLTSVASVASELDDRRFSGSVHAYILKSGFGTEKEVGNAVLNMYMKNGAVQEGCMVFDCMMDHDTISWNALLSGFHSASYCKEGLKIFRQMLAENFTPNKYTFITILRSCTSLRAASYGTQVHAHILKNGLEEDSFVGAALLDMYTNCGYFTNARLVFGRLKERDVFAWTTIITGYTKTDQAEKAINCFCQMQREGVSPNVFTLASCLRACSNSTSLDSGRQFHSWAIKSGQSDAFVLSALVDMYVKSGCLKDAEVAFYGSTIQDEVSWNTVICGYSQHGYGEKALEAFQQMIDEGNRPDEVTFIGVLSACGHDGLLNEGWQHFDSLTRVYGITPTMEHYACLIDILGKAGNFDEVEHFISEMTLTPDASIWQTVLGACRMHGNVELGERAAEKLFQIDPHIASTYILLSNMYAASGRWDDVARVRKMMSDRGIKKEPGCSWVEIGGQFHVFLAQDGSHPMPNEYI